MWGYSYNYPHTRGINRYIKFGMGPEVQRALLAQTQAQRVPCRLAYSKRAKLRLGPAGTSRSS